MDPSPVPCRFAEGPLLREPADLDAAPLASEDALHVRGARVVLAEYDVLQHDFPELRTPQIIAAHPELEHLDAEARQSTVESIIDEWLIANAAFVSTAQAAQAVVNTPIETDGSRTVAYRPPTYRRAVVVPTQHAPSMCRGGRFRVPAVKGMLDLKGAGVTPEQTPSNRPESNGLEHLGIAIGDFLVKKAIDEVLARELPCVWTVPVYAVLDLGFDAFNYGELGTGPAGLHVRRAHRRRLDQTASSAEHAATFAIEMAFRRYGITASTIGLQHHIYREAGRLMRRRGRQRPIPITDPTEIGLSLALLGRAERMSFDRRDVQLAREVDWPPAQAQIVDFGAIRIVPRFDCPIMRYYEKPLLDEVIRPSDPAFLQPDPSLRLPTDTWDRRGLAMHYLEVARRFRRGEVSSGDIRREIDERVRACLARWATAASAL